MLVELRKLIPAFLTRVDREDRGVRWSRYLADTRRGTGAAAERFLRGAAPAPQPEVALTDFDPDGEVKVVAAALYESSRLPESQLLETARGMSDGDRAAVIRAYAGDSRQPPASGPGARSSGPAIASMCCRTTARSATCNATGS